MSSWKQKTTIASPQVWATSNNCSPVGLSYRKIAGGANIAIGRCRMSTEFISCERTFVPSELREVAAFFIAVADELEGK